MNNGEVIIEKLKFYYKFYSEKSYNNGKILPIKLFLSQLLLPTLPRQYRFNFQFEVNQRNCFLQEKSFGRWRDDRVEVMKTDAGSV